MDQFYELLKLDISDSGGAFAYVSVSGLPSGTRYTFEIHDSLWNNIPYTSTYIGAEYRLTPTGLLASSGVTFSVLYNGVVAAKKTTTCGIIPGTYVRIL